MLPFHYTHVSWIYVWIDTANRAKIYTCFKHHIFFSFLLRRFRAGYGGHHAVISFSDVIVFVSNTDLCLFYVAKAQMLTQ